MNRTKLFNVIFFFKPLTYCICPLPYSQVDASTLCPFPTLTARAPVKPVSPSHWSCPPKVPSPMEPTLPPPWRKAPPHLGKLGLSLSMLVFHSRFPPTPIFGLGKLDFYSLTSYSCCACSCLLSKQDFQLLPLAILMLGKLDFHYPMFLHCYVYLCVSIVFTSPCSAVGCCLSCQGPFHRLEREVLIRCSWKGILIFNFPTNKQCTPYSVM